MCMGIHTKESKTILTKQPLLGREPKLQKWLLGKRYFVSGCLAAQIRVIEIILAASFSVGIRHGRH